MATEFLMPKLGLTMEEGTITEWFADDGASITAGAPLLRIETDKTETDVEAAATGRLHRVGQVGETFACGERIGWFLDEGEDAPASAAPAAAAPAPRGRCRSPIRRGTGRAPLRPSPTPAGSSRRRSPSGSPASATSTFGPFAAPVPAGASSLPTSTTCRQPAPRRSRRPPSAPSPCVLRRP